MTFIDFKKMLLDADTSLPKFSKLIKVSEKNIQAYKKKKEVPNTIAVIAACFASMKNADVDYKEVVESLQLQAKTKKGVGFAKKAPMKKENTDDSQL
jgi:hypothetical protein